MEFCAISVNKMNFIIEQLNKTVIKIKKENCFGTGFLCSIPFHNNLLPVIVTNNHILEERDISLGQKLHFTLNNDRICFEILIDKNRKVYTNKFYDITFIEIKRNDGLDISSFLEVDQNIFNSNENELVNKSVYLLSYPYGKEAQFSSGSIKRLESNGINIIYSCLTDRGCTGSPIINLNNYKVIAVHQGPYKKNHYKICTFLKKPIEDFNKLN